MVGGVGEIGKFGASYLVSFIPTFFYLFFFFSASSSPSARRMASHDNGAQGPGAEFDFQLYRYVPSLPAAIVSVAVFAILTVLHTWRVFRSRAFYFTAFTIGGACKLGRHRASDYLSQTWD